jgi:hypothetical protein
MTTLTNTDILLFTSPAAGSGRDENDKRNKLREHILDELFHGRCDALCLDPTHGAAWMSLRDAFQSALKDMSVLEGIQNVVETKLVQKGGRGYNYDFLVTFQTATSAKEVGVEFKFGGTSVDSLPEFFNPSADKSFHPTLYASFYYTNYLAQVAAVYGLTVPLPTETEYLKAIHKNTPSIPFLKALDAAERADEDRSITSKYKQKQVLVAASINAYLEKVLFDTNFSTIEAELKRSQGNKRFLIYSGGRFHHDALKPTELELEDTVYVKNRNTLMIQTKDGGHIEMLLRWKNHLGVLFPAWQISLSR